MYEHFDDISGISFLPFSEHSYKQAPYQECDEDTITNLKEKMPDRVDWTELTQYEAEDTTSGGRDLACAAGVCEVVDLT